jgi:hypothetical protein
MKRTLPHSNGTGRLARLKDLKKIEVPWEQHNVMVTASYAMTVLGAGADPNRTIKEAKVNAFARDMIAGGWEPNGAPVRLAEDGKLIDGEHRMWSVVRAEEIQPGVAVPMTILTSVPRAMRPTFDTGSTRSFADVLKIEGKATTRTYSSILRYIALYQSGALASQKNVAPTHQELEAILTSGDTAHVIESFIENYQRRLRQPSVCGFVYWRALRDDEAKAEAWVSGVMTGVDMSVTDPRYLLRERYNEPRAGKIEAIESMALAIKSWNAFYADEPVSEIRWRSRGRNPEAFPQFYTDVDPETLRRVRHIKQRKQTRRAAAKVSA